MQAVTVPGTTPDSLPPRPRFSLIIPAYNEARVLPRLLDSVDEAAARYHGGRAAVEVVVGDNASTDGTARIAEQRGCRVARIDKRVIAAARNGAARIARGDVLAFVDADTVIHAETFNAIERAMAGGRAIGGATGVQLDRLSPGLAVTYAVMVTFVWITGMDTGVVFCRRQDFETIGGYDESLLYAEDVRLLLDLRRLGRTRGQRLVRLRPVKAIGSTRKFDERGDWHYFGLLWQAVPWLLFGRPLGPIAREYWYDVSR